MPPWALGVSTLEDESAVITALSLDSGGMRPANEFIALAYDATSPLYKVREAFVSKATRRDLAEDFLDVLDTFNRLLIYEVGRVYTPWYTDTPEFPKTSLKRLEGLPRERKDDLGIFYSYERK